MANSPLAAPVNRPLFADARCGRGAGQPLHIAGPFARGGGGGGVPLNSAAGRDRGVSPPHFLTTEPQIFFPVGNPQ